MAKQLEERARVSEGQQSTGGEVARLSAEVAALAQSEARARSEAAFAEARAEQLQGELAGAVQGRWGVGSPPYLPQTSREQQEAQHLEAKLTVRAEAAEAEVGRLRAQLACASAGIPEAGYTSTPSHGSTGGLGAKEVELQRQLMLRENDLASAVEEKVSALAEASALRAKLVDAAREVEAAQKRHAECERQLYDRSEAASRRALAASSSFSAELMQLRQQTEEAEREAKAAAAAKAKARLPPSVWGTFLARFQIEWRIPGVCQPQVGC